MNRKAWVVLGAVAALAIGAAVAFWPRSDEQLSAAMVGRWLATDPQNASLHKHTEGVDREEIDVLADGTLTFHAKLKAGATMAPATSPASSRPAFTGMADGTKWGWRVVKRRLQLKDMGEDSTQEWLG